MTARSRRSPEHARRARQPRRHGVAVVALGMTALLLAAWLAHADGGRGAAERGGHARPRTPARDRSLLRRILGRRLWRVPLAMWIGLAMLLTTGGGAYAYFGATGSGAGQASVGTSVTLLVKAASPSVASLLPGGSGAVYFTVFNPDATPVTFTAVSEAGPAVSSTPTGCPATNVTISAQLPLSLTGVSVPANRTSPTLSIATFLEMAGDAPTGCQGVTFTVPITLEGKTT